MPNFTDITGLVGVAIATTAMALLIVPGMARLTKPYPAILLGVLLTLMLVPLNGLPLAAYVRGVTGDLSVTTLLLLCIVLMKSAFNVGIGNIREHQTLLAGTALAALALYPMALGASAFDPYQLGYGSTQLLSALLLVALAAWFRGYSMIAACISLATIAWAFRWYESDNLWDYLLDPFVSVYALAAVIIHSVKAISQRRRTKHLQG